MINILSYIGKSLLFNEGYKRTGFIFWGIIFIILYSISDCTSRKSREEYAQSMDYEKMCADGNFKSAHAIKSKYYSRYSEIFGSWRGGKWCDREVRQAQEKYHSVAKYIFGQEVSALYYSEEGDNTKEIIALLTSIPVEGAPLEEGKHGSGMFFNNDASIGTPSAIDHVVYQTWVRFYNDCCDKAFDMAIANNDIEFAKRISSLYKTEINTRYEPDTIKGRDYNIATVTYSNARIELAKQRVTDFEHLNSCNQ